MSDQVINKLVAERLGYTYKQFTFFKLDYCNKPSDAWPIILENKIGIDTIGFKGGEERVWWAELAYDEYGSNHYAEHENPLRAAMIVFLMMGEG